MQIKRYIYTIIIFILILINLYIFIDMAKKDNLYTKYQLSNAQKENLLLKLKSDLSYLYNRKQLVGYRTVSKEHIISLEDWNDISQII